MKKIMVSKLIFVTSDSKDFIKAASEKSYVFTVSGEIVHIDKQCTLVKTDYSKEFLDMLMLARSSFIYVCKKRAYVYAWIFVKCC